MLLRTLRPASRDKVTQFGVRGLGFRVHVPKQYILWPQSTYIGTQQAVILGPPSADDLSFQDACPNKSKQAHQQFPEPFEVAWLGGPRMGPFQRAVGPLDGGVVDFRGFGGLREVPRAKGRGYSFHARVLQGTCC